MSKLSPAGVYVGVCVIPESTETEQTARAAEKLSIFSFLLAGCAPTDASKNGLRAAISRLGLSIPTHEYPGLLVSEAARAVFAKKGIKNQTARALYEADPALAQEEGQRAQGQLRKIARAVAPFVLGGEGLTAVLVVAPKLPAALADIYARKMWSSEYFTATSFGDSVSATGCMKFVFTVAADSVKGGHVGAYFK